MKENNKQHFNSKCSKILLFSAFLIFIQAPLYAQDYIGSTKRRAERILTRTLTKDSVQFNFIETDTSLNFILNDEQYAKERLFLHFSADGICDYVKLHMRCSECMTKHFSELINNKYYHWKKLGDKKYASKKRGRLILEILPDEKSDCPYIYLYRYPDDKKAFKKEIEGI